MHIIRTRKYQTHLLMILKYIAQDKVSASRAFQKGLDKCIKEIPDFPFKYRPSIYFDDVNIRDMVYKKYTINYEIDVEKNQITILHIFNQNKPSEA